MATDLRPDIVWWNDSVKKILLIELTICFESSFQQAAERKQLKYEDVMSRAKLGGYSGCVITLEVGSRGIVSNTGFSHLKSEFNIRKQDFNMLLTRVSAIALIESYRIWCQRNSTIT